MTPISTIVLLLAVAPAPPAPAPTPAPAPAPAPAGDLGPKLGGGEVAPADDTAGGKDEVTYYQFSGLGIDGELRTPALLQFLSRIGGEFETVGIPHRSFMPELSQTVMEDSL